MLTIDGSLGEGGGQILRASLSLAMITGQPVVIEHIRAKRPKPGLMRQHLACVLAAQTICAARVQGAALGSQTLVFEPGPAQAGAYTFAVGSAGSCLLVLQTVLPALMLADAPSRVTLSGGTHNPLAPNFHFIERAFVPLLARMGVNVQVTLKRHGFYPAGGGEMQADIAPAPHGLQPFDLLEPGPLRHGHAEALLAGLPRKSIAERELAALATALGWPPEDLRIPVLRQNEGPGNALLLTLAHEHVTEVFASFGEKAVSSEQVAARLLRQLDAYRHSGAAVGPHLADQLALPLALAVWRSGQAAAYTCSEVSEHTRTHLDVIGRFLPVQATLTHMDTHRWRVQLAPADTAPW
jgi:RNA 3'-terminal phosphate cyclase (ATP)